MAAPFVVVTRDGETLPPSARFKADTINVGPGQHYDVIWTAHRPGKWLIHCHIGHHTTNNNVEIKGGGLMRIIESNPYTPRIQCTHSIESWRHAHVFWASQSDGGAAWHHYGHGQNQISQHILP
jgi:hypothetical protein